MSPKVLNSFPHAVDSKEDWFTGMHYYDSQRGQVYYDLHRQLATLPQFSFESG